MPNISNNQPRTTLIHRQFLVATGGVLGAAALAGCVVVDPIATSSAATGATRTVEYAYGEVEPFQHSNAPTFQSLYQNTKRKLQS